MRSDTDLRRLLPQSRGRSLRCSSWVSPLLSTGAGCRWHRLALSGGMDVERFWLAVLLWPDMPAM